MFGVRDASKLLGVGSNGKMSSMSGSRGVNTTGVVRILVCSTTCAGDLGVVV